ncbi:MAG: tetratricopeptide repeat protein, partial [Acidobacteriota bacterium]|nr:tetratricopeptide repeat protein [Acidobacteriota bacterium]
MKSAWLIVRLPAVALAGLLQVPVVAQAPGETLWHHRNLGKAFYENPTTRAEAVEEFRQALALAPDSARERVNYGLALLRAGRTAEGVAELERAKQQDPRLPHTWFNLGIVFKRESQYERAVAEFEQMVKLVPGDAVSHYNLGYVYKLTARPVEALAAFERAAALDPNMAGPRFQLYNAYRDAGRPDDAARELKRFQDLRRRQTGAAVPEDLDWGYYAEIYDPADTTMSADASEPSAVSFVRQKSDDVADPARAGLLVL